MKHHLIRPIKFCLAVMLTICATAQALNYPEECYETTVFGVGVVRCH